MDLRDLFFSCEGGLHKACARRAPCVRFARVKRLQSRRQFSACTPVVRFGNFIGEPYEIGATEHIACFRCYRALCPSALPARTCPSALPAWTCARLARCPREAHALDLRAGIVCISLCSEPQAVNRVCLWGVCALFRTHGCCGEAASARNSR